LADVPVATAEILFRAGIDWGVLAGEERCCGYMPLALGYRDVFERYAKENSDVINRLGVETVVTSCPECYYTLKTRYPDVAPLNVEVLHTTELFYRLIGEGSVKLRENSVRATYHDPCYLGRYCDMYETPRDVIRSIPGVELVEMERNRMDAWCCGAGGGVRIGKKDYAVATGTERVDEAISSGADLLITSCPNCLENFWDARGKGKSTLAIQDIATLIGQSLIT
jgi:Fe-S oxidoreductase